MKVIIAGTRTIVNYEIVRSAIALFETATLEIISEVVCGKAPGVDTLGENWAINNQIPLKPFPADWTDLNHPDARIRTRQDGSKYDANAGPIRNKKMADYADALLLIWDGESKGSANMKRLAESRGLMVVSVIVKEADSFKDASITKTPAKRKENAKVRRIS